MSDARNRAAQAESELRITGEAIDLMRSNALETIAASKSGETALRENLYRTVQVLDTIKKHLQSVVDAGTVEQFADAIREQSKG
jgi:hypothetical protein